MRGKEPFLEMSIRTQENLVIHPLVESSYKVACFQIRKADGGKNNCKKLMRSQSLRMLQTS